MTAQRIAWGRFINAGQTCIAPDYILCEAEIQHELATAVAAAVSSMFGEDPEKSPDFCRIVNGSHTQRILSMIEQTRAGNPKAVVHTCTSGRASDAGSRYIAPTVIEGCTMDDAVMQQEIFGPVLPIVPIRNISEAVPMINAGEKPLALYVFSNDTKVVESVIGHTSSGAALSNDCLMHAAVDALPFGGVGNSGMGAYHGKHSFDLFSHTKAVMLKDQALEVINTTVRYPPYTDTKKTLLKMALGRSPGSLGKTVATHFGIAVTAGLAIYLLQDPICAYSKVALLAVAEWAAWMAARL